MIGKNIILVEGTDDLHVVAHLLKSYGYEGRIQIEKRGCASCGDGIDKLLRSLPHVLIRQLLERIAIIVDANADPLARWQAVRNRLMASGSVTLPDLPNTEGTIATIDQGYRDLQVGIWLMPDNQSPGMLEDFTGQLARLRWISIPDADDLWDKAKLNVDEIVNPRAPPNVGGGRGGRKAYIHTWLAWQEDPGKPLGLAITFRYLDANAAQAQKLIAFLRQLFEL